MELHHQKHHQTYVNGLNAAEEQLQQAISKNDVKGAIAVQKALNFNGGGAWPCLHMSHPFTDALPLQAMSITRSSGRTLRRPSLAAASCRLDRSRKPLSVTLEALETSRPSSMRRLPPFKEAAGAGSVSTRQLES